jgi:SagB-type dehydrogenase family enzyme
MQNLFLLTFLPFFFLGFLLLKLSSASSNHRSSDLLQSEMIKLPSPVFSSSTTIEEALLKRRSIREYKNEPLSLEQLSQLLWAAQGITDKEGKRTAPSAGALYGLEVYAAVSNVKNLDPGFYRYDPHTHSLSKKIARDVKKNISSAALGQSCINQAAVNIVIAGVYDRIKFKYGERGIRYTHMEAGHAAQNVFLQAVSLKLGTVVVGAFRDDDLRKELKLPSKETPLYIMPVGKLK